MQFRRAFRSIACAATLALPFCSGAAAPQALPAAAAEVDPLDDVVDGDMRALGPRDASHGTGFQIDPRGFLLTAAHVVAGCRNISVRPVGFGSEPAKLITMDTRKDLALLQARRPLRNTLAVAQDQARSTVLAVYSGAGQERASGDFVIARTVTPRRSGPYTLLSFTPALDRGASGSPVIDGRGLVVGVSVGTIDSGGAATLAISATEIRAFLGYAGVAMQRRSLLARAFGADRPISRADVAQFEGGIVSVDCD